MNKRGSSTILYGLMIGVLLFWLGLALAPSLSQTTGETMNSTLLNCSNSSISYQYKAVCTSIDSQNLFIPIIMGLAGFIIGSIAIR